MTTFVPSTPTLVPCPECPDWFKPSELKWHREIVHNADSEARWLASQQTGENK